MMPSRRCSAACGCEGAGSAAIADQAAEQVFAVLGELKGGAMKVGQALSVLEAAMPEEMVEPYREMLVRLQDAAPPMSTEQVHEVLRRDRDDSTVSNFTTAADGVTTIDTSDLDLPGSVEAVVQVVLARSGRTPQGAA